MNLSTSIAREEEWSHITHIGSNFQNSCSVTNGIPNNKENIIAFPNFCESIIRKKIPGKSVLYLRMLLKSNITQFPYMLQSFRNHLFIISIVFCNLPVPKSNIMVTIQHVESKSTKITSKSWDIWLSLKRIDSQHYISNMYTHNSLLPSARSTNPKHLKPINENFDL